MATHQQSYDTSLRLGTESPVGSDDTIEQRRGILGRGLGLVQIYRAVHDPDFTFTSVGLDKECLSRRKE